MSEHMNHWLGAYHDGELNEKQLRRVEKHLAECTACSAELEEIRSLSALLQESASEDVLIGADRFVSGLMLSLPRREMTHRADHRNKQQFFWWLVPVSLLLVMTFIDITSNLSLAASIAAETGFLSDMLPVVESSQAQMSWFVNVMNLFGDRLGAQNQALLSAMNEANLVFAQLVRSLLPQALLSVAYIAWLFTWWFRKQENLSMTVRS